MSCHHVLLLPHQQDANRQVHHRGHRTPCDRCRRRHQGRDQSFASRGDVAVVPTAILATAENRLEVEARGRRSVAGGQERRHPRRRRRLSGRGGERPPAIGGDRTTGGADAGRDPRGGTEAGGHLAGRRRRPAGQGEGARHRGDQEEVLVRSDQFIAYARACWCAAASTIATSASPRCRRRSISTSSARRWRTRC